MTDAYAGAEPDLYSLTLFCKGATATLQFHVVEFVDAKSADDAVQQARRAPFRSDTRISNFVEEPRT